MDQNTPPPDRHGRVAAVKPRFSAVREKLAQLTAREAFDGGALYAGCPSTRRRRGMDDEIAARDGPKDLAEDVRDAVTTKD